MTEFRILGPLEVEINGQLLRLGPQQRVVLLALLIASGRTVSKHRLVELLWDPEPPDGASSTVRSHIHHLRRTLRAAGSAPVRLDTVPGGYLLEVGSGLIDAERFECLVAEGRAALAAGDPYAAVDRLRAALAIWRGQALADVAERPFAAAEITRLNGKKRAAQRSRFQAALEVGCHAEITDEIPGLLTRWPDDEHLRGLLALALFRTGRQCEATEVLRVGVLLAREHGLDTPQLQRLQSNVLRRDPALDWRPPMRGPRLLPPAFGDFVGRVDELALLRGRAGAPSHDQGTPAISLIVGKAGIGKTALALRIAHELAPRFPDGQLYVDLGGRGAGTEPDAGPILGRLLRALGVPDDALPASIEARMTHYRSLLLGKRALIVLDNAASADHVRTLLPTSATCAVFVTSRDVLGTLICEGAYPVSLEVFTPAEAIELLTRLAGAERIRADPAAAGEIARLCGYLPLAVRLAGAKLAIDRGRSLAQHAVQLDDERQRLRLLAVGEVNLRAGLASTCRALPAPATRMFALLGLVPGRDWGIEAAAVLAETGGDEALVALTDLMDAGLVEAAPGPGRYRFHDLVRLYASERAANLPDREEAADRMYDWYLDLANAAERVLCMGRPRPAPHRRPRYVRRFTDRARALEWFETERANLTAAVHAAAEQGRQASAWMLADALWYFFRLRKYWGNWQDTYRAGLAGARACADRRAEGWMLSGLGVALWELGDYLPAVAHHHESLDIAREVGDRHGEALALNRLGIALALLDRHDEAIGCLQRSLRIRIEVADRYGQAVVLANLGEALQRVDRLDEALDYQHRALRMQRDIGDLYSAGLTLNNLGEGYLRLGQLRPATVHLEQALGVHRQLGHRWGEGIALANLSRAAELLDRHADADAHRRQARAIFAELGAPEAAVRRFGLAGSDR